MITAHYTTTHGDKCRWDEDAEFLTTQQDFTTLEELEHFLAYYRANITELSFTGSINFLQDKDN